MESEYGFISKNKNMNDLLAAGPTLFPRFAGAVVDEPELQSAYCGSYVSTTQNMPCTFCEVIPKTDGLTSIGPSRSLSTIRTYFTADGETRWTTAQAEFYSIHPEWNQCFWVPGYNPFTNPPCLMHQFSLGIFSNMVLDLCVKLLTNDKTKKGAIQRFDLKWAHIRPFRGGKVFRGGVSNTAKCTAAEYDTVSMYLPLVLRDPDLHISNPTPSTPSDFLESVACSYLIARWLLGSASFSKEALEVLSMVVEVLQRQINKLSMLVTGSDVLYGNKFHKMHHWVSYILTYGSPRNFNAQIYESAHKTVKRYRHSFSHKDSSSAAMKVMELQNIRDQQLQRPLNTPRPQPTSLFRGRNNLLERLKCSADARVRLQQLWRRRGKQQWSLDKFATEAKWELLELMERDESLGKMLSNLFLLLDLVKSHLKYDQRDLPTSWNSAWCRKSECYAKANDFVRYKDKQTTKIGCLKYLIRVNEMSLMIVMKMREIPLPDGPQPGESLLKRIRRVFEKYDDKGTCKNHFWTFQNPIGDDVHCYHVADISDLVEMVNLQPDHYQEGRYFLLEYNI